MNSKGHAVEITSKTESKNRWRSQSSVSGYLDDLSQEHKPSSGQTCRSSNLSVSGELQRDKTGSIYKSQHGGWMATWRWSRMRKKYRRKAVAIVNRSPSTNHGNRKSTAGSSTDEPVISSEDFSNKEINHVDLGKHVKTSVQMDDLIIRRSHQQSGRVEIRQNIKENYFGASLNLKYQPKHFQDIVGHETIIRAMNNAIQKNKVVSLYLFHGPVGTGKSSTAKILAMALNCEAGPNSRPCWNCRECSRSLYVMDMCSGSGSLGFEKIKTLIQSTSFTHALPGYKVFVIEECHLLTPEAWDELLGMIEGLHSLSTVFVLITMDGDLLPVMVSSRCQKYFFAKVKDADIKLKLDRIAAQEGIMLEKEAIQLIIAKADGSLREAENILDQLTLLGTRITTPMVQEIVSLVPQEKLRDLLMAALAGNTMKTIQHATELLRTGVEVQSLVSQLASLVKDTLSNAAATVSGSSSLATSENRQSERLCHALKALLNIEKKSKSGTDQSTRLFAALLQIAPQDHFLSAKSDKPSTEAIDTQQHPEILRKPSEQDRPTEASHRLHKNITYTTMTIQEERGSDGKRDSEKKPELAPISSIDEIWLKIVERIHNSNLKEFLSNQVKLASLTISTANAIVHLMFKRLGDKMTAEMSKESISKALQDVVGCPVTVNMSLEPLDLQMMENDGQAVRKEPGDSSKFRKQPKTSFHPANVHSPSSGHLKHSKLSQILSPLPESKQDDSNNTSNTCLVQHKYPPEEKKPTKPFSQQRPSFQRHRLQEARANATTESETNHQASAADASHPRSKNTRQQLSLSSIRQSDVSIEPYSQDILYESRNVNNQGRARRSSMKKKSSLNSRDEQYSSVEAPIGELPRSWSCREIFCQQKIKS